jgi:hypothetical protein
MDKVKTIIERYEEKYNERQSNICLLWINYLKIKLEKFNNVIEQAEYALNNIDLVNDVSLDTIKLMLDLQYIQMNNNEYMNI